MMTIRRWFQTGLAAGLCLLVTAGGAGAQVGAEHLIRDLAWRNIGPANMSGRVTDIEALDDDYRFVIVASASGGVWKSVNAGTTWEPIFDDYGAASIGSVAIFQPDPDLIWVGTGEPNNRNSVAWGNGIYKSTDGGETFTHMGLEDTHQISHVLTHPTDPDIVYVGAIGHLWGYSGDRGVFKTTDGGRNWERIFYKGPETGCSALVMDPREPETLYAGMYQRLRRPWRFDSGGPDGGIFKTTDGGNTWRELTNGLPPGDTGKIGLAISRSNPDVLAACVEAEQIERDAELDPADPKSGIYRSEDAGESWSYVNSYNNRPFYYSHIFINPQIDDRVYLVMGSFRYSEDGGSTLQRMGGGIHGDYHAMWCDPHNPDRFYIGNDGGVALTHDHSDSYIFFDNLTLAQFYAVGADMRDPYYVYGGLQDNGTWGGPSRSRDSRGILTDDWASIGGGDGFHVQVDPDDWRSVWLESQGGSIRRINVETRQSFGVRPGEGNILNWDEYVTDEIVAANEASGWRGPFRFNWSAPIVMSPHNGHTVYFGGNYLFKTVDEGRHWTIISPDLSTADPVKMDRDTGGLTSDVTGAENHCTIITISESPLTPGLVWVGTDDGNVQLTRDGGTTWTNVRSNVPRVPDGLWVSRVEASHHDEGTCYLTFDGHRSDEFTPWVFKTDDYGRTWTDISSNLPDGHCVYVIKEDLENPDLLFLGTEFSCFVTLTGGARWHRLMNGLPTVAVHDLLIHPRDRDLIAGTHGRGIWILDDITALEQYSAEIAETGAALFEIRPVTDWLTVSRGGSRGSFYFSGENPPDGALIHFYLETPGTVILTVSDVSGELVYSENIEAEAGLTRWIWDLRFDPTAEALREAIADLRETIGWVRESGELNRSQLRELDQIDAELGGEVTLVRFNELMGQVSSAMGYRGRGPRRPLAEPGTYRVTLTVNGQEYTRTVTVRADPLLDPER